MADPWPGSAGEEERWPGTGYSHAATLFRDLVSRSDLLNAPEFVVAVAVAVAVAVVVVAQLVEGVPVSARIEKAGC